MIETINNVTSCAFYVRAFIKKDASDKLLLWEPQLIGYHEHYAEARVCLSNYCIHIDTLIYLYHTLNAGSANLYC